MITHITKEQEARFPEYVERFIGYGTNTTPCDREKAEAAVALAYKCAGIEPPKKYTWFADPLQARQYTGSQSSVFYGGQEAGWLSHRMFLKEVLGVTGMEAFDGLYAMCVECGWVHMYDTEAVMVERPSEIRLVKVGDETVLHNPDGPSVAYANSDFAVYSLWGVRVPKWLVTTPKYLLDPKKILSIENVEIRQVALRLVGVDHFTSEAKVIDKDDRGYVLYDFGELLDLDRALFLKMENQSVPGHVHIEGVSNECRTIQDAINDRLPESFKGVNWEPEILT